MSVGAEEIDVVRGQLDEASSDEILSFWASNGALEGSAARDRLSTVVCVARNEESEVVGVNSVYEDTPRPPDRRMWVYRSFITEESEELQQEMFTAAFDTLEAEFDESRSGPVGVCILLSADEDEIERRPEAVWPEEGLIFAGYDGDNRQVRLRWFWDAPAEPGLENSLKLDQALAMDWSIDERYRVEPFTGAPEIAESIIAMWDRENVVPLPERRRRVQEALNVVIDRDEGVVAVSTAYVQRSSQLDMNLWYFRTFVASPHRNTHIATQLTMHNRDLLEQRFLGGEDTRARGVGFELENRGMRKYINTAIWQPVDFIFVGDNDRGIPLRVHYFPGCHVPPPSGSPA